MSQSLLSRAEWKIYRSYQKHRLKNKDATIISSNCNGAVILHDLECPFNSPTVNMYFSPKDYLKFVSNLEVYLEAVPEAVNSDLPYPVGKLLDITLYFMHYQSFEEAKDQWTKRAKRVNLDNCFFMMTDKNGCTHEDLVKFDALPNENKVVFTHKQYPDIKSSFYIKGFEQEDECGILSDFRPGFFRRRWLDQFDYVSFLDGKGINK